MEEKQLTVTVEQAAKLLGISRGLAFQLAREGKLPVVRLGVKRLVVPRQALMEMLQNPASSISLSPNKQKP